MKTFAALALCLALPTIAAAQQPAPGWFPTGEWQCGPVRIITSTDGWAGVNFEVRGAWFDNNYTFRRGQLFYNGLPCLAVGRPLGSSEPPRRKARVIPDEEIPEPAGDHAGPKQ
jgi:hypothetical protein